MNGDRQYRPGRRDRPGHRGRPGRHGQAWPAWRHRRLPARCREDHLGGPLGRRTGRRRRELHHRRPDQQPGRRPDDAVGCARHPGLLLGRLSATDYTAPAALLALPNVTVGTRIDDLGTVQVVLATAAKWATVKDRSWRWAIIDEAYQMRSDMLLLIAARFERALFVGDPGQLDPFSVIETPRWIGLPYDPTLNAVTVLQAHNPELPRSPAPRILAAPRLRSPSRIQRVLPVFRLPGRNRSRHPASGVHRSRDTQPRRRHLGRGRAIRVGTARAARPAHDPHRRRGSRSGRRAGGSATGPPGRRHMRTAPRRPAAQPAGHRDRSHSPRPGRPDPSGPSTGCPADCRDDQGRHRQPPAGRRIRRHHRLAPAVRTARRDSLPSGGRPPVRPGIPPPPRLHRRRPRRDSRPARRPPFRRAHPPRRPGQVSRRLGSQPCPARPPRRPPGTSVKSSRN